jgi:hypothetical protein
MEEDVLFLKLSVTDSNAVSVKVNLDPMAEIIALITDQFARH